MIAIESSDRRALDLVGRDDELAALRSLLEESTESGAALVIDGEAGSGKSTLLTAAIEHAQATGFRVLRGTGLQDAMPTGFGALHEVLHPLLPRAAALPSKQQAALLTAFALQDGPPPDRLVISIAALGLLEAAATRRPVLIAIEDLQWIDASSADILEFVGRRLSNAPIVLLATQRSSDLELSSPSALQRLTLGPLPDEDAAALLDRSAPLPPLARARVLTEAGGNPLALIELPIAIAELGTRSTALQPNLPVTKRLERAFLDRLDRIPDASRRLLVVTAASDGAELSDVLAAARLLDVGVSALEPLERVGLLAVAGGRPRFRHPLLRSALRGITTTTEWLEAHRALAAVVPDPSRAAWHRAAATLERDESIAAELDVVGRAAAERGAQPEAARAYQRAATLSQGVEQRTSRLARAAEAWRSAGRGLQAAELLDEIEVVATDPATIADIAVTRTILSMTVGGPAVSAESLARIRGLLATPERMDHWVTVLWAAAVHARGRGLPRHELAHLADQLREVPSRNPLKPIGIALVSPLCDPGGLRARLPSLVPQVSRSAFALVSLALAAESLQDFETSLTCWGLSVERFHELGAAVDEVQALRGRAQILLMRGRIREAIADAEHAARVSIDTDQPLMASMALATLVRAHAMLGDDADVERALREHVALAGPRALALASADARWGSGLLALMRGRHREAQIEFTHMTVHPTRALWAIADRTEAAVLGHRPETVRDNVDEAAEAARAYNSPHLTALVSRSRALLAEGDDAEGEFARAVQVGELDTSPFELARTRLLYGGWLRRQRRLVEARTQLTSSLHEFDLLGSRLLAARASAELRAAGEVVEPRAAPRSPDVDLTPQELQVALLAAQGMSNKQIADQVYLSHRTVSTHLYRVYPKVGIASRGQLAAVLRAAGHDV